LSDRASRMRMAGMQSRTLPPHFFFGIGDAIPVRGKCLSFMMQIRVL